MTALAITVPLLCGLAFDIEKDAGRASGYRPAFTDLGAGKWLFGDLRLDGFAAALRTGFADELILAGGDEGRYKGETVIVDDQPQPINRAWAIREMLIHDCDIDPNQVHAFASRTNTYGNIAVFRDLVDSSQLTSKHCGLMTNLYHLPRAAMDLAANKLPLQLFAAEALWVIEDKSRGASLVERLGGGPLAERVAAEAFGMADKLRGTYVPKTNIEAGRLGEKVSG